MLKKEVIDALYNYGYRYVGKKSDAFVFAKPLGYGVLRVEVYDDNAVVDVSLIVRGESKDGDRQNLIWNEKRRGVIALPGKDMYFAFVQAISDCEAEIFIKNPIAIPKNREVRYDFEDNLDVNS